MSLHDPRTLSPRLVLASGSPRRRELLAAAGIDFEIVPADIPEELQPGEQPVAFATRLAREKAVAVAERLPGSATLDWDHSPMLGHAEALAAVIFEAMARAD